MRKVLMVVLVLVVMVATGAALAARRLTADIPRADLFEPVAPNQVSPSGPTPSASGARGSFLVVGLDTRTSVPGWRPHADAVMVVTMTGSKVYVTSLPRDLYLDVPAYAPSGFAGRRAKLTEAMALGCYVDRQVSVPHGFALLARTVTAYTHLDFSGGAVLDFSGMRRLVDHLGGITLVVDQTTTSHHLDSAGRPLTPGARPMRYTKGVHHLNGWQALDFSRQRYGLPRGDYDRARHQRQVLSAMFSKLTSSGVLSNPFRLQGVVSALGDSALVDTRGESLMSLAWSLRGTKPSGVQLVSLPGHPTPGRYRGEILTPVAGSYFRAAATGGLDAWVRAHPSQVARPHG